MRRLIFPSGGQTDFLRRIQMVSGESIEGLARICELHPRTVRDWVREKRKIDEESANRLAKFAYLPIPATVRFIDQYAHIKGAGRLGGINRMRLHGSPGTAEGRRKGGLASQEIHQKNGTKFILRKVIKRPAYSDELAEFMGIMLGDGHLTAYQASVTTSSKTDMQHALFVRGLFQRLFCVEAPMYKQKDKDAIVVQASSAGLSEFLQTLGMPLGDKLKGGIRIPSWVKRKRSYQAAFLRGLFDTDGCIFLDKHVIKGKLYAHPGWMFTSASESFRKEIYRLLRRLKFHPTLQVTQRSVFIRRQPDIQRYVQEIGTSNEKHRKRYQMFTKQTTER